MDFLTQYDPKVIEAVTNLIATVFTVLSGVAAAVWAVLKYFDDRRKEREANSAAEKQRLEQQNEAEKGRRAERVATLISEFGKAGDPEVRGWTTLALSMYPKETTRLLTMSLSQFSDEAAAAVRLALVGIGAPALPELTKLNRIARVSLDNEDSEAPDSFGDGVEFARLLKRTQSVIVRLLFYLENESIAGEDLSELDLSGCNLQGLKFEGIAFRKCNLNNASFKRATIKKSVFRGASLEKTNFLKTALNEADLTGATGGVFAVKSYADAACFDHAHIQNSQFDGASLRGASFVSTNLDDSSMRGAQLHESIITKARLSRIDATKIKAHGIKCSGSKLASANFNEGDISESTFERCGMMGMSAQKLTATNAKFLNCNLGGADFKQSKLAGTEFRGCILGGADFRGCDLSDVVFHKCKVGTAKFDEGVEVNSGDSVA